MITQLTCDECGATVIKCDNSVLLDAPAVDYDGYAACWTIMPISDHHFASVGGPGIDGKAHTLHEHQPPEVP